MKQLQLPPCYYSEYFGELLPLGIGGSCQHQGGTTPRKHPNNSDYPHADSPIQERCTLYRQIALSTLLNGYGTRAIRYSAEEVYNSMATWLGIPETRQRRLRVQGH